MAAFNPSWSLAEYMLQFEDESPTPTQNKDSSTKSSKRELAQDEPEVILIEDSPPQSTSRPAIKKKRKQVETDNCVLIGRDSSAEEILKAIQLLKTPERAKVKTELLDKAESTSNYEL